MANLLRNPSFLESPEPLVPNLAVFCSQHIVFVQHQEKIIQFCETTSVLVLKLENVAKNFTKVREQTFADSFFFREVLNMQ